MLHETLHYFLGDHVPNNPQALSNRGVMNLNWSTVDCYLFTGCIAQLEDEQIRKIQKQPKPAPNLNVL